MPHLVHEIRCVLINYCPTPHDCENLGSQVTCHTYIQFPIYISLKRTIEKKFHGLTYIGATTHLMCHHNVSHGETCCLLTVCAHRS